MRSFGKKCDSRKEQRKSPQDNRFPSFYIPDQPDQQDTGNEQIKQGIDLRGHALFHQARHADGSKRGKKICYPDRVTSAS